MIFAFNFVMIEILVFCAGMWKSLNPEGHLPYGFDWVGAYAGWVMLFIVVAALILAFVWAYITAPSRDLMKFDMEDSGMY